MSIVAYDAGKLDGQLEERDRLWDALQAAASTGDNLEISWEEARKIFGK